MEHRMLYGVTIHDSIKRGNASEMQQLLAEARQAQKDQGDLGQAINDLERALGYGGGGSGPRPLYGVVIHDSIKRGNKDELRGLLEEARKQHADLGTAIQDLERSVGK